MKRRDIDEYLETLWHLKENNESDIDSFRSHTTGGFNEEAVKKLQMDGYIKLSNEQIALTDTGEVEARIIVRRHRLAERLLTDVLGMKPEEVEAGACEFEHILAPELTESICILLGHPRLCPHGTRIPEGECCKEKRKSFNSAVLPLNKAEIGRDFKVAYINTGLNSRIHKLFHFQIAPGATVKVSQRYPAFVIHSGNTQLALEEDIAREIYVWGNNHE